MLSTKTSNMWLVCKSSLQHQPRNYLCDSRVCGYVCVCLHVFACLLALSLIILIILHHVVCCVWRECYVLLKLLPDVWCWMLNPWHVTSFIICGITAVKTIRSPHLSMSSVEPLSNKEARSAQLATCRCCNCCVLRRCAFVYLSLVLPTKC